MGRPALAVGNEFLYLAGTTNNQTVWLSQQPINGQSLNWSPVKEVSGIKTENGVSLCWYKNKLWFCWIEPDEGLIRYGTYDGQGLDSKGVVPGELLGQGVPMLVPKYGEDGSQLALVYQNAWCGKTQEFWWKVLVNEERWGDLYITGGQRSTNSPACVFCEFKARNVIGFIDGTFNSIVYCWKGTTNSEIYYNNYETVADVDPKRIHVEPNTNSQIRSIKTGDEIPQTDNAPALASTSRDDSGNVFINRSHLALAWKTPDGSVFVREGRLIPATSLSVKNGSAIFAEVQWSVDQVQIESASTTVSPTLAFRRTLSSLGMGGALVCAWSDGSQVMASQRSGSSGVWSPPISVGNL